MLRYLILLVFLLVPVDAWATVAQRIVSLGPINTENVFLLGAGDRLVGNTVYCVRPKEAADIEKVGTVMQVSVEKSSA
jgi:iron complex transport system substrate-binding protein